MAKFSRCRDEARDNRLFRRHERWRRIEMFPVFAPLLTAARLTVQVSRLVGKGVIGLVDASDLYQVDRHVGALERGFERTRGKYYALGRPAEALLGWCRRRVERFSRRHAWRLVRSGTRLLRREWLRLPDRPVHRDETTVVFTVAGSGPTSWGWNGAFWPFACWARLAGNPQDLPERVRLVRQPRVPMLMVAPLWVHELLVNRNCWFDVVGPAAACAEVELAEVETLWSPDSDETFHDPAEVLAAIRSL